jgi:hypothetical protein
MNDVELIRTPQQIIAEFTSPAAYICSGGHAREDCQSRIGGEAKTKYRPNDSAITRGLGHSVWACTGGKGS